MDKCSLAPSAERSALMARIRGKNTKPEILVRKFVSRLGYRYRLHGKGLPGTPDLVFPQRRKVIFVHGCFWHRHKNCKKATTSKTRTEFWSKKFADNKKRDRAKVAQLKRAGWDCLIVWECETNDLPRQEGLIKMFLDGSADSAAR